MEEKVLEIKKLLNDVEKSYQKSEAQKDELRKKGECFNIFNVQGHWGEEVKVHSAFIAQLLNPEGLHGCGVALLKKFCEKTKTPFTYEGATVYTEKTFCNDKVSGRFDIFIEQVDKKKVIVIENKVYAGDQDSQLLRYNEYCKGKYGSGNYRIFYLTLDGHEPSEYSSCVQDRINNRRYWTDISYKNDIVNWLNDCKGVACDKSRVKMSIEQYIDLIKQITNDTLENEMKDEVIKLLERVTTLF